MNDTITCRRISTLFYLSPDGVFAVSTPIDGKPASLGNGGKPSEAPPGVLERQ